MFDYQLHPATKQRLLDIAASPSQAYMFTGPRYVYKERAAEELALALAGARTLDDPNILRVSPGSTGRIKIDQAKEALAWLSQTAYHPEHHRVALIVEADCMTNDASNALLKMIEEPGERVVFIMVTSQPDNILPTVRSRVQRVMFAPFTDPDQSELPPRLADIFASDEEAKSAYVACDQMASDFIEGSVTRRFAVAKQSYELKNTQQLLGSIGRKLVPTLASQASTPARLEAVVATEAHLRQNVNPRLCLENLALEFAR